MLGEGIYILSCLFQYVGTGTFPVYLGECFARVMIFSCSCCNSKKGGAFVLSLENISR